jgi:hypothetical protein
MCSEAALAQHHSHTFRDGVTSDFHAGLHSGSWTLRREALLNDEKQDSYRSCDDPYCNRCAKHLADYGHEYQYLGGPHQRQPWYRGTAGGVAVTTRRGYDQHGIPYARRGQPAAIMSWEYRQTLNHAIWEQVNARNAVAAEEAAKERLPMLEQLLATATEQYRLTQAAWEKFVADGGHCIKDGIEVKRPSACSKTYKQFADEMKSGQCAAASQNMCAYCLAKARCCFDQEYVAMVKNELAWAQNDYLWKQATADEAVRVALLSKDDADKATRFVRIQNKPPKIKEAAATREYLDMIAAERNPKKPTLTEAPQVPLPTPAAATANDYDTETVIPVPIPKPDTPNIPQLIDE